MSNIEEFSTRMKMLEQREAGRKAMPRLPIIVRLDGNNFSKWTKGLERPFDERLSNLMVETTEYLLNKFDALIGYCQSDEISLLLYTGSYKKEIIHNGKYQKLVSLTAAKATAFFNERARVLFLDKPSAVFDSRAFDVPDKIEATNEILWREEDATKNSISMAARCYYSHKELQYKHGKEMMDMLMKKGINWNDYPAFFKRGTFVQKKRVAVPFSVAELEALPPKHQARQNPDLVIERNVVQRIDMPPFNKVVNRVEVLFDEEDPIVAGDLTNDHSNTKK